VTDNTIVPPGAGHVLTARGSVMAFKAEELHNLWSGPDAPDPAAERALMARYGMEPA
jgi:hypothetical protein